MSYILGALKKADQERRRSSEVKVADWDQDDWDDPTPADHTGRWLIGIVLCGLVVVLSIFGFVAFRVLETVPQNMVTYQQETMSGTIPVNTEAGAVQPREADQTLLPEEDVESVSGSPQSSGLAESSGPTQSGLVQDTAEPMRSSQQLPEFSGHLYFPGNPGLSRVFANSSSYTEGDMISGYRIEQIGESSLLLSKDGEEIQVSLRN